MFDPAIWYRHALLTCAEMRRAEEVAYARGLASFDAMRRAGEAVADIICKKYQSCRTLVLCGPGNNGGDGFIVAENLRDKGWNVTVAAMRPVRDMSGDAVKAAVKWRGETAALADVSFEECDLVVDALFGTGLARPLEDIAKTTLEKLATTKIPVVAVDLPSGINGDTGAVMGVAAKAAVTVTFFHKKLGHMLLPGATLCGETIVADIGIADEALDTMRPQAAENHEDLWLPQFPFPQPEGHKYSRGHALIYGGGTMTGAARLAARAAQRTGAGLVTLAAPLEAITIYSVALESAIVRTANDVEAWRELLLDPKRNAILIGPGLGLGEAQAELVLAALATGKPCVLDADALSNFSHDPALLLSKLHARCVLTPHEGEFARLFGAPVGAGDKLLRARRAAMKAGCVVLLKGADTVIASPKGAAIINGNAPPWLAVAGAGDVLAGMILGLVAQNMEPFAASAAAAALHGEAANDFGHGLIAEDLVESLPAVLERLSHKAKGV
jgi:NAD(P)H-hydrate epimerase